MQSLASRLPSSPTSIFISTDSPLMSSGSPLPSPLLTRQWTETRNIPKLPSFSLRKLHVLKRAAWSQKKKQKGKGEGRRARLSEFIWETGTDESFGKPDSLSRPSQKSLGSLSSFGSSFPPLHWLVFWCSWFFQFSWFFLVLLSFHDGSHTRFWAPPFSKNK